MNLSQWLECQQSIHPRSIELGLERVREVFQRLGSGKPAKRVITVAGTNGKGSTVAFVESIARAAGYRVGAYTSPHLLAYNERVRIDGVPVDDSALIHAFEAVEAARGDTALTYFEFGTLAALWLFAREALDLVILEVGLGGRLDAVNVVDADAAIITTIALDHVEFLGSDRESIAREKAGVLRAGKPVVIAEIDPPDALLHVAEHVGSPQYRAGRNYRWEATRDGWVFQDDRGALALPLPALRAPAQLGNASAAITALRAILPPLPLDEQHIAAGVATATLPGRMQVIPGPVEVVLDVAHNPQAAQQLASWLQANRASGATLAVFAALADKDVANEVAAVMGQIDIWLLAGLTGVGGREQSVEALWQKVGALLSRSLATRHVSVAEALSEARRMARAGDRIVVFGSFHTVAEALAAM
ncbi:bifunctional tetrahydrofolate synthase/dihydrofolate synthase [Xanthomonadaceae bacterium XH05]|nr:bifunctional tetrahydrofolate synthase/dihydrofolate synthase [Xanthomonadaceae bacterium XH05]